MYFFQKGKETVFIILWLNTLDVFSMKVCLENQWQKGHKKEAGSYLFKSAVETPENYVKICSKLTKSPERRHCKQLRTLPEDFCLGMRRRNRIRLNDFPE